MACSSAMDRDCVRAIESNSFSSIFLPFSSIRPACRLLSVSLAAESP